jgi:hypothetical protein
MKSKYNPVVVSSCIARLFILITETVLLPYTELVNFYLFTTLFCSFIFVIEADSDPLKNQNQLEPKEAF